MYNIIQIRGSLTLQNLIIQIQIMSRRGNSVRNQDPRSMQIERADRMDPFRHMQQMMAFGGLHNDPFFNSMVPFGFGRDHLQEMFKFSDIHKGLHSKGTEGSYVFQSFVSSSKMGPDGKIVQENYFENNMGQHRGGNTISQKQQAYKNNQGVNRIAEERMLNDKGRKIMRQKIGNNIEETNHYYNIDEQQAQQFDNEWRQADNKMNFINNHQKYLQKMEEPQMRIEYQPHARTYQPQQQVRGHRPIQMHQQRQPNRNSRIEAPKKQHQVEYQPASSNYSGNSRISKKSELPVNSKIKFGKQ